jgi:hypothetical protein
LLLVRLTLLRPVLRVAMLAYAVLGGAAAVWPTTVGGQDAAAGPWWGAALALRAALLAGPVAALALTLSLVGYDYDSGLRAERHLAGDGGWRHALRQFSTAVTLLLGSLVLCAAGGALAGATDEWSRQLQGQHTVPASGGWSEPLLLFVPAVMTVAVTMLVVGVVRSGRVASLVLTLLVVSLLAGLLSAASVARHLLLLHPLAGAWYFTVHDHGSRLDLGMSTAGAWASCLAWLTVLCLAVVARSRSVRSSALPTITS